MTDILLNRAKDAIQAVFNDTTKPVDDTYAELEELREDIQSCLNCLDET